MSNKRAIWRPYTQEQIAAPAIEIARASGAYLYSKAGQEIFDGISSWWLITHGHCHPRIVEAVQKQAAKLDQVTFANFTHEPAENLAELLLHFLPKTFTRVFFSDNGSTAVEVALKMALQACEQRGLLQKTKFIAFAAAYHGDTVGAMSVSGASAFNKPYRKTLFEVIRANHPSHSQADPSEYVKHFAELLAEQHANIAGVIIEPLIQGAGGMVVWPKAVLVEIAKLCRSHNVLLIFDEVMTGFGRTGAMFAMDKIGITPDLLCLSKGLSGGTLPLACTVVGEEIYTAFLDKSKDKMFFHGHSFTGNPIACAAGVANLQIYRDSDLTKKWREIESAQKENLEKIASELPLIDSRLCGTMAAIEIDMREPGYLNDFSGRFMQRALAQGLFLRPLGNIIYLLPPFSASSSDIERAWKTILACALAELR